MINISVSEFMIICSSVLLICKLTLENTSVNLFYWFTRVVKLFRGNDRNAARNFIRHPSFLDVSRISIYYLINGVTIVLLLTEVLDWTQLFSWVENECNFPPFTFGYADRNGPHMWKVLYPDSNGSNQSPINITTGLAVVVQPSEPLRWSGYNKGPLSMTIVNNGNNVIMNTIWSSFNRPYIEGGCLDGTYDLCSIMFHWGESNEEGSEHTLDYARYPMELQVWHIKRGIGSLVDAMAAKETDSVLIVSFFFQITNADNPYLDHVVTNLWRVVQPGTKVHVPPFPLVWIFPSFQKNYYTYSGSLTQPPCSEIVTWIVQPEPIAISSSQVANFRKVCSSNGPVLSNCRPVQRVNERSVYFYA